MEMFFKIAINNVKRSFNDYFIYFLTLTFAVCIFYSFNSIEAQNSMLEMGKSTSEFMGTINKLIAGASVFVSFILGGLIVYANNFLIKRRKRELGIYMTLGMPKGKISKILIIETILIGLISLVVGIILGIIVSQGLSIITANLLALNIIKYKFIISVNAVIKAAVYFGIIFLIVMLLNQRTISKYKLIDMLNASKKNEKIRINNSLLSIIIFLISVAALVIAYILILEVGLNPKNNFENNLFIISIMMGIIGTLLFFFSLSSFFIHTIQKNKKIYFKDLNIFVLRQVNNKINTNFLSMTVICLMIFLTITLLFTMFSFKGAYSNLINGNTSFDGTIQLIINQEDQKIKDVKEYMDLMDFKYNDYEKHAFFSEYKINITRSDLLNKYLNEQEKEANLDDHISVIKASEYNSIIQLKGQPPISIGEDEVLLVSNYEQVTNALNMFLEDENTINIDNKNYTIKNKVPIKENIATTEYFMNFFFLIVPDNFSGELNLYSTGFNVMFEGNKQLKEKFSNFLNDIKENYKYVQVLGDNLELVNLRVYGSTTMIVFLGVYLGIVFLVSSAAVLALQQLSDISDSIDRYKSLKKIGVNDKLINKSILQQNLMYFMIPLVLAIIHSIIGMIVINRFIGSYSSSIIGRSSLMASLTLFVIYGGYFYVTYIGAKNIVRNSN